MIAGEILNNRVCDKEKEPTDPVDALKAFSQMRLDSCWVFGLGENLQQLIIREEIESRESHPLGLQVLTQSFLNLFQQLVALTKILQKTVVSTK